MNARPAVSMARAAEGGRDAGPVTELTERLAPLMSAAPGATATVAVASVRGRHETLCRGTLAATSGAEVGVRTRFELGSVTKTFTALLLADLVVRGEVRLEDPVSRYLPPGARARSAADRVTLLHLATHTSGLPRVPYNLIPVALPHWYTDPYAAYTPAHLVRASRRIRPRTAPGRRKHYSNLGIGLLGQLLARAAGDSYENLLAARVCGPLGLSGTTAVPPAPSRRRQSGRQDPVPELADMATGHRRGRPLPPGHIPGLVAAGGLCSTARDLARCLDAYLRPHDTPLTAALREVCRPRVALAGSGDQLALVWNVRVFPEYDLYFHSGATRGFTVFVGFCPRRAVGLAAMANTGPTWRSGFTQLAYDQLKSLLDLAETGW